MEAFDDTSGTDAPSEGSEELASEDQPTEATRWAAEAEAEGDDADLDEDEDADLDDEDDDDDDDFSDEGAV